MTAVAIHPGKPAGEAANIELRAAEPTDAAGIHALLTGTIPDVITDSHRWRARWDWQCWSNPYRQDRPGGWVLLEGGRLIGHMGAVYLPLRIGGQRRLGVVVSDYAVCAEARGRTGLLPGLQLAQMFFDSARATECLPLATTANEKTGAVFARFGCKPVAWTREFWRAPANLEQLIRSCLGGQSRILRRLQSGRLAGPFNRLMTSVCGRIGHPVIPVPSGCFLDECAGLERRIDELARLDGQSASADTGVERSAAYLAWRYAQHPEWERIRLLILRGEDCRPIGAAVVFVDQRPDRNVAVVEDIFAPADRQDAVKSLLCAALRFACDSGVSHLITTGGQTRHRLLYWELGFEARARSAPAVLLPRAVMQRSTEESASTDPEAGLEFWHGAMF